MQMFKYSLLYVKVTTASVVEYCKCCLIGTEVGCGSEIFFLKEGLLLTHHFVLFFLGWGGREGGGNAFSGEFEKKTKVPLSPLYKLI